MNKVTFPEANSAPAPKNDSAAIVTPSMHIENSTKPAALYKALCLPNEINAIINGSTALSTMLNPKTASITAYNPPAAAAMAIILLRFFIPHITAYAYISKKSEIKLTANNSSAYIVISITLRCI